MNSEIFFNNEDNRLTIGNNLFSKTFENRMNACGEKDNADSLSEPFTKITTHGDGQNHTYCIWEDLSVVYMPDYSEKVLHTIKGHHWIIKAIRLNAFTDECDTLTNVDEFHFYKMKLYPCTGDIFFLENPEDGNAVVIISEMPDYQTATLSIEDGNVMLENGSNPLALGFCKIGECEKLCRNYYRHARKVKNLIAMSNTWGDFHRFDCAREDFAIREIDAAKEIGVETMQIDDGWQIGSTDDLTLRDEDNRRIFNENFWELNKEKFPSGIEYISEYGKQNNVKTGLWFAPESHDDFALLQRDINVLKKAYFEWGFRYFKLDMYWITNPAQRDKFLELLKTIYSFGDDVEVQLDVTRNERVNYLCGRQYGTVFVENRYTSWRTAYPHRTLRNLWMLSRYIPSSKFQFEINNPDINTEVYSDDDAFRPCLYDMDYLFAAVMVANPLFWMELQFLSQDRRSQLKNIIPVWKEHRSILAKADVEPIGEKPSGRSFTGFYISTDGKPQYLLLLRESTEKSKIVMPSPVDNAKTKILASNTEACIEIKDGMIYAEFNKPRSYAFVKLSE